MNVVYQTEPFSVQCTVYSVQCTVYSQASPTAGWLVGADARAVGLLSQGLGAGRALPDDVST